MTFYTNLYKGVLQSDTSGLFLTMAVFNNVNPWDVEIICPSESLISKFFNWISQSPAHQSFDHIIGQENGLAIL